MQNSQNPKEEYNPKNIENKWVNKWEEDKIYKTRDTENISKDKPKMHVLDMFPYPSGEGLHAGHAKIFSASDAYARMKRMQGFNVLHATGWDAFGLPAEQFAIKNKVNPKISTKKNTETYEAQMKMLGLSYDWDRTVNTTDENFYKWTQWIFKQLYKQGLCYESNEPINWCPSCMTGLANEDLDDGKCERCGSVVEKKPIRQWVIKITEYAEKLLQGVDNLEWKESIKEMQRNWIGKSVGAEIDFKLKNSTGEYEENFKIFTTRPDTLFGATYCVFAPEHAIIKKIINEKLIENISEVEKYILEVKNKSEIERTALGKEKSGIQLNGVVSINPVNQKEIPIFIADYVLGNYGTGAIMAVPSHDERDKEFAEKYNLPFIEVIENNKLVNSEKFDGIDFEEAKEKITEFVGGKIVTRYKIKDWVFARQRYWGEPFPIVFDKNHRPFVVADKELPVVLPNVESYEPTGTGEGPLADIKDWVEVKGKINDQGEFESDESGETFYRETNTMPQWAGSSWYWLRYLDPKNNNRMVGIEEEKYWSNNGYSVDIYLGGLEHATRHLIYARFWNQFLFDHKIISHKEPFKRLEAVGLVLGKGGVKMSKRLGNVVNPDEIINQFGADTLRLYIAFAASFHDSFSWDTKAIVGPRRFIERVWSLKFKISDETFQRGQEWDEIEILLNQTIKKITEDYEKLQFNTAISQMMIFVNAIEKFNSISIGDYKILLKLLAPICPFFTEEIWASLPLSKSDNKSIHLSQWPKFDSSKITNKNVNIAVQINGKLRDVFVAETDLPDESIIQIAKETEGYKKWVGEAEPKKIIVVKNKIVNIVA